MDAKSRENSVEEQDMYMVFECLPQVGDKIVRIQQRIK